MRTIEILFENGASVICQDDENSELSSFCEKLSNLLSSKKVSILSTSDGSSLILSPSKITIIKVIEEKSQTRKKHSKRIIKSDEKQNSEDYISDG